MSTADLLCHWKKYSLWLFFLHFFSLLVSICLIYWNHMNSSIFAFSPICSSLKPLSCWDGTKNLQTRNMNGHTFTNWAIEMRPRHLPRRDFPWVEMCSYKTSLWSLSVSYMVFSMAVEVMNACEFNRLSFSINLNGMNKGGGMIKQLK